jgi:hypothetical protein
MSHSHRTLTHPLLAALVLLAAGCRAQPLLSAVAVTPAAISPNADGDADVTQIAYTIGDSALVTIELTGPDGITHRLRDRQPRSAGSYTADFGGVIDGRMLPDGDYTVRVVAEPRSGEGSVEAGGEGSPEGGGKGDGNAGGTGGTPDTVTAALAISGADTEGPELIGLTVQPSEFTPNQDGIGDRVAISYRLDAPAEVRLTLVDANKQYVSDILEDQEFAEPPGQPGPKQYDFDAGVDADAPPPPDGQYFIVAEARDGVGNVTREELPLVIKDGGQPRAAIVGDVEWSSTILPLGETLVFTATVENIGDTPIRTRGPAPGFVYDNNQTFNQQLPAGLLLLARDGGKPGEPGYRAASRQVLVEGRSRIDEADLDFAAGETQGPPVSPDVGEQAPPAPGDVENPSPPAPREADAPSVTPGVIPPAERITLCGTVRDAGQPVPGAEVFAFEIDGDRGQRAVADAEGRYCFEDLTVPPPGQRTYARSSGALRLGLQYDDSPIDLEYPFRWQLGPTTALDVCEADQQHYLCLPPAGQPGSRVQVTGGLRFAEPPLRRDTTVYLSLMHEDVRRMHGPFGQQRLTVEY